MKDQSGSEMEWSKYIEFMAISEPYSGVVSFSVGEALNIGSASLSLNFRGIAHVDQGFAFDIYLQQKGELPAEWVEIGDTRANIGGWSHWVHITIALHNTIDFTRVQNDQNEIQIRIRAMQARDNWLLDFFQLTTEELTAPPKTPITAQFNLRVLVLSESNTASGANWALLAFDSVGMPYDYVPTTSTTDLTNYLSTTGVGKYSGIVSVKSNLLSAAQKSLITWYQAKYGVKWVIVASSPSGVPGLSAGTVTSAAGAITIAPQFARYSQSLKFTASVDTGSCAPWSGLARASVASAIITDASVATPALLFTPAASGSSIVAAAAVHLPDGTLQLHYFVTQHAKYRHSLVFSAVMLNWISPGGVFQGERRLTFSVQPDDLLLASFLWDPATHTNPFSHSLVYRMTAEDMRGAADFVSAKTAELPAGSLVTIEWPFNGAGPGIYAPDSLFEETKALQDKFWFLSHTWSHPCTFNTDNNDTIYNELYQNIMWTPQLLNGGINSPRFTKTGIIPPCITGLFNPNFWAAMRGNGMYSVVGDNSLSALKPSFPYHGIWTSSTVHGYTGGFIVPRAAYDIYYDCSTPEELLDEYNTLNREGETFEGVYARQRDYAVYDMLAYRQDPHMFHQANLRLFDYYDPVKGNIRISLTTLWMDRVLDQLSSYYSLPIISPKFGDVVNIWRKRMEMDGCGFNAQLVVDKGKIIGLVAKSENSCVVQISGVVVEVGDTVRVETVGPETTSYITMTVGVTQTLQFTTPVSL